MKTGIVFEILDGRATVMRPGGAFVTVPAQPCWRKGDVVALDRPRARRPWLAAAACLLLLLGVAGFGGWQLYAAPAALVSVDVNPSFELTLSRTGRVLSARGYNAEANALLAQSEIARQPVGEALETLFAGGLGEYLGRSPYLTLSVQAGGTAEAALRDAAEALRASYPGADVTLYTVDEALIDEAHSHHVTAGKYQALLELQALDPAATVEEYAGCGIGEIQERIHACQNAHGEAQPDTAPEPAPATQPGGQCHQHRHGGGHE